MTKACTPGMRLPGWAHIHRLGERRLTVQIELIEEKIAQARGLANRAPKPDEWAMLKRWYAEVVEVVFKLQ